ncbi:MAG: hypothetical protein H7338_16030 [Candidatus Sericytochromatia bacterium]|nr:hypothetical protein [Candidatus Sericytochromatia bacterium]
MTVMLWMAGADGGMADCDGDVVDDEPAVLVGWAAGDEGPVLDGGWVPPGIAGP